MAKRIITRTETSPRRVLVFNTRTYIRIAAYSAIRGGNQLGLGVWITHSINNNSPRHLGHAQQRPPSLIPLSTLYFQNLTCNRSTMARSCFKDAISGGRHGFARYTQQSAGWTAWAERAS